MDFDIKLIAQNAVRIENNNGQVIYFDPFKLNNDYNNDADYIFITHSHFDHFSEEDIMKIKKDTTKIIATIDLESKMQQLGFNDDYVLIVEPNEEYVIDEMRFNTIPAYNLNKNFHKKEFNWVSYILSLDDKTIYIAGDTDNTEEARRVKCDIACAPVGGTYTMTYKEAAELISIIRPKIAVPTHYKTIVGSTQDAYDFKALLEGVTEVKILME